MSIDVDAAANAVAETANGSIVGLNGSAALNGFQLVGDQALGAAVNILGTATLSGGSPTLTTPTVLRIAVLGDSTANSITEWVYLLLLSWAERYGDWFHWVGLSNAGDPDSGWEPIGFVNFGTTSRIVEVWNSSFGGASFDDLTPAYIAEFVVDRNADIVILAQGVNETGGAASIATTMPNVVDLAQAGLPSASFVVSSENPTTPTSGSSTIRDAVQAVAATRGYPFVDVYQAFINYGDWESLLADAVHPTSEGQQLWVDTFNTATFLTAAGDLVGTGDMTVDCSTPSPAVACTIGS